MTAARQERKSHRCRTFFIGLMGMALGVSGLGLVLPGMREAAAEAVVANVHTGLAIDGFDPVTYFVDGAPQVGRAAFELHSGGATWRFRNEGNRAAFAATPDVYRPRFGGHDPTAMARGVATPGNPEIWQIAGKRLYLFYNTENRADFAKGTDSVIEAAEQRWPEVSRSLLP
jgi:hypothetical protein